MLDSKGALPKRPRAHPHHGSPSAAVMRGGGGDAGCLATAQFGLQSMSGIGIRCLHTFYGAAKELYIEPRLDQ